MVQQDRGAVSWGGSEVVLLSALRPIGSGPLELSLFGSRWGAQAAGVEASEVVDLGTVLIFLLPIAAPLQVHQ